MREYRGSKNHPYHISCGAIVYRETESGKIQVLLLHRRKTQGWLYDSWHLPKGTKRIGEREKETVRREVLEETGFEIEVLDKIGSLRSTYKVENITVQKITHYFTCQPIKRIKKSVDEHDEAKWIPLEKAIVLVTQFPEYEPEEKILEKFKNLYE